MNKLAEFLLGTPQQINDYNTTTQDYEGLADQVDYLAKNLQSLSPQSQQIWSNLGTDKIRQNALNGNSSNIGELQKAFDNMGYEPTFNTGLNAIPRKDGLLDRIAEGYNENVSNGFKTENLLPNNNGLGYKLGEGLGTATRFLDTPLARGLISAGLVNMAGGNKNTMIKEGLAGAVGRQNARTQDQVYRNQLKQYGYTDEELADVKGNITNDIYKNLATNIYKNRKLDQDSYIKMKYQYDRMLQNGMLSPTEYQQAVASLNNKYIEDNIVTTTSGKVQKSNQTRNTEVNEYLAPSKAYALRTAPQVALGNLAVNQARLNNQLENSGIDNAYKIAKIEEIQNNIQNKANQNPINSLKAIQDQMDRFSSSFGKVNKDKLGAMASDLKTQAGFGNEAEVNFNSQKQLLFNKIARELGGEKGVLSDQDIKRIQQALPNLSDSYQQKQAKMKAVYNLLGDRINQVQPRQNNGYTQVGKYKVRVK